MKKLIFALPAFVFLTTSCDKEETEPSNPAEVNVNNISGTYKFVWIKLKTGNGPDVDITSQMDQCEMDDTQTFNQNGTFNYTDAGTKCVPPGDYSGGWTLPSTTQLTMDGDPFTIKSFDGDKLELSYTEVDQGITYTTTVMMDKQ